MVCILDKAHMLHRVLPHVKLQYAYVNTNWQHHIVDENTLNGTFLGSVKAINLKR